ncbi:MAG: hypothetical protein P8M49_02445, partial [Thalassotalea sp.]|nr:hypothetical protein [Thalassotalea sp.]
MDRLFATFCRTQNQKKRCNIAGNRKIQRHSIVLLDGTSFSVLSIDKLAFSLKYKKRLASRVTGVGIHRIKFDTDHLDD